MMFLFTPGVPEKIVNRNQAETRSQSGDPIATK